MDQVTLTIIIGMATIILVLIVGFYALLKEILGCSNHIRSEIAVNSAKLAKYLEEIAALNQEKGGSIEYHDKKKFKAYDPSKDENKKMEGKEDDLFDF